MIHSSVWKLQLKNYKKCQFCTKMALNGPNFAISEFFQHIEYDFLKEDQKNNFHTKNQEDSQRRLEVIGKKLSKLSILAKKWPNFGLKWQKFAISEFSRHIEYDFLKEDHKNNFHTKNQEDSQRRLEVIGQKLSKLTIFAKKWPNFGLKWPKFRHIRIFPTYRVRFSKRRPLEQLPYQKIGRFIAAL